VGAQPVIGLSMSDKPVDARRKLGERGDAEQDIIKPGIEKLCRGFLVLGIEHGDGAGVACIGGGAQFGQKPQRIAARQVGKVEQHGIGRTPLGQGGKGAARIHKVKPVRQMRIETP